jgi:hypothetical protein
MKRTVCPARFDWSSVGVSLGSLFAGYRNDPRAGGEPVGLGRRGSVKGRCAVAPDCSDLSILASPDFSDTTLRLSSPAVRTLLGLRNRSSNADDEHCRTVRRNQTNQLGIGCASDTAPLGAEADGCSRRGYCQVSLAAIHQVLLSGSGVSDLRSITAVAVTSQAIVGERLARESVLRFLAALGSVARDCALMYSARGGVYTAGGIVPRFVSLFE